MLGRGGLARVEQVQASAAEQDQDALAAHETEVDNLSLQASRADASFPASSFSASITRYGSFHACNPAEATTRISWNGDNNRLGFPSR